MAALPDDKRKAFSHQLEGRDLEGALTRIRRIGALVDGDDEFDGLTGNLAIELDREVCKEITKALDLEKANLSPVHHLAAWAARADYELPVEFFTVNYDLLLETALDGMTVPYFDGFVGTVRAGFHTELVEGRAGSGRYHMPAFYLRLWKLHGSVNWAWDKNRQIVRLGQPVSEGDTAAIFPSDTKYEESRRVPFVVLQDRFRRALHQPESLVLISGYSFGDAHLNDMVFDAAARCPRSEFQVYCYSDIPDFLSAQALKTPNLQVTSGTEAIIGGVQASWEEPEESPPDLWIDGQFGLRDFEKLCSYLSRSVSKQSDLDSLAKILKQAVQLDDGQDEKVGR